MENVVDDDDVTSELIGDLHSEKVELTETTKHKGDTSHRDDSYPDLWKFRHNVDANCFYQGEALGTHV